MEAWGSVLFQVSEIGSISSMGEQKTIFFCIKYMIRLLFAYLMIAGYVVNTGN